MNTDPKIINNQVGLLKLAAMLDNVSAACHLMGYSRDSYERFKELSDQGGELARQQSRRRPPCLQNRAQPEGEQAVVAMAPAPPAYGQGRVSNE